MDKNILRMSMNERFKYINEQKRKKFNPTSEEKEAQKKKNNERK